MFDSIQKPNFASEGRQYLYDLYSNPVEKCRLVNAVEKYFEDNEFFDSTCSLMENGSPARYNYTKHEFEYNDSQEPQYLDFAHAKRDYVIHCIDRLAKRLFSDDGSGQFVEKLHCVKKLLIQKMINKGPFLCEIDYKKNASRRVQVKAEKSLNKFLKKILNDEFQSAEEKKLKHSSPIEEESEVDVLKDSISKIDKQIQGITDEKEIDLENQSSQWSQFDISKAVAEVLSMIENHIVYSDIGKKLKINVLAELIDIKGAIQKKQEFNTLKLNAIFSKEVKNRFPDEVWHKLEKLKQYILEVEQFDSNKQQLQELLKEKKIKLEEIESGKEPKTEVSIKNPQKVKKKTSKSSNIVRFLSRVKDFFLLIGKWLSYLLARLFSGV